MFCGSARIQWSWLICIAASIGIVEYKLNSFNLNQVTLVESNVSYLIFPTSLIELTLTFIQQA